MEVKVQRLPLEDEYAVPGELRYARESPAERARVDEVGVRSGQEVRVRPRLEQPPFCHGPLQLAIGPAQSDELASP